MFSFLDYVKYVWDISEAKRVDLGIAFSMLKADIRNGNRYNTEGVELEGFDIEAAHAAFGSPTEDEELAYYDEWFDFKRRCNDAICKAYPDQQKIDAVVTAYRGEDLDGDNKA